jgi:hypothetical protein
MKDLNITNYIGYFKDIAGRHKDIQGFYIMDINELEGDVRSKLQYPALVLTALTGDIAAGNDDNILNNLKNGFIILQHVNELNDYKAEMDAMASSFQIGLQVISKIRHDVQTCSNDLADIDMNSIKYEMMGPVYDNDWGVMFTSDIFYQVSDLVYNAAIWLDEPKEGMSGY